jgi:glycine C-acetyltransferase
MRTEFDNQIQQVIQTLKQEGTYKELRHLESPMDAHSMMREAGGEVIVLSSNNYLGLSNHPDVKKAAIDAIEKYGAGTASVRFICGTMTIHEELEKEIADFHQTEAATTYSSCWSANGGLFSAICKEGDVIISDELNHASIIDGMRLVKKGVNKAIYAHSDMADLEKKLQEHANAANRFIVTDGVFSMEGDLAKLPEIVVLAEKYQATIIVDDSHGVGVVGKTGRGTAEHFGVMDKIDITTGTLGKALGGAAGGYVSGKKDVIDLLIQQSRSQIFSNGISPATAGTALASFKIVKNEPVKVASLQQKSKFFRGKLLENGFKPLDGESAIVPIIVGKTALAIRISEALLKEGFFVTGFGFPVVPEGTARIRVQISDSLSYEDMEKALSAFVKVGKQFGII